MGLNKDFEELGKAVNKLKQTVKESSGFNQLADIIFDTIEEIIKVSIDNSEQEKPKSYPLGRDPEGEWVVLWYKDDEKPHWKVLTYDDLSQIRDLEQEKFYMRGMQFTTEDQAQLRADGLNNLNLLIEAIHEFSHVKKQMNANLELMAET